MNTCHGKHDGKFCSGASNGKLGKPSKEHTAILNDINRMINGGGEQIKKASTDHFNDPSAKRNEIINHTKYPHIPSGQFKVSIEPLQKGGASIEATIKPITMTGGFVSGYEIRGGGLKGALKGSELENLIETGQYKIKK